MKPPEIFFDTALAADAVDLYEVSEFAARVVCLLEESAQVDKCFCISFEGAWGSGKSTVINRVCGIMDKDPDSKFIPCVFSPWEIAATNLTTESFYFSISEKLEIKHHKKISKLVRQAEKFRRIGTPYASSAVGLAGFLAGELLADWKTQVERELKKRGKRLLLIIDDIDRLPPAQIQQVFRLIGSIGRLNGFTYILAFDRPPVAEAMSFNGGEAKGAEYLEKIIQYPVRMPALSPSQVANRMCELLSEYHEGRGIPDASRSFDQARLGLLTSSREVLSKITTPRRIESLFGRARGAAFHMDYHVSIPDLIAAEMLMLEGGGLIELVDNARFNASAGGDFKEECEIMICEAFGTQSDGLKYLKYLLRFLFPQIFGDGVTSSELFQYHTMEPLPVLRDVNTWRRYIHQGDRAATISPEEFAAAINDGADRQGTISSILQRGLLREFFFQLNECWDKVRDIRSFANLISEELNSKFMEINGRGEALFEKNATEGVLLDFVRRLDQKSRHEFSMGLSDGDAFSLTSHLFWKQHDGRSVVPVPALALDLWKRRLTENVSIIYSAEDWHGILHSVEALYGNDFLESFVAQMPKDSGWLEQHFFYVCRVLNLGDSCLHVSQDFKLKMAKELASFSPRLKEALLPDEI